MFRVGVYKKLPWADCGNRLWTKVTIFDEEAYQNFVKQHYAYNHSKRTKLLLEEIPEKMIERQMNDTRYISKFVLPLLSNLVRAKENDNGVNSKMYFL